MYPIHIPIIQHQCQVRDYEMVLGIVNGSRKRSQPVETSSSMDEKRKKRLEKNREIAKNCRKRKKEKREALEEEVGI